MIKLIPTQLEWLRKHITPEIFDMLDVELSEQLPSSDLLTQDQLNVLAAIVKHSKNSVIDTWDLAAKLTDKYLALRGKLTAVLKALAQKGIIANENSSIRFVAVKQLTLQVMPDELASPIQTLNKKRIDKQTNNLPPTAKRQALSTLAKIQVELDKALQAPAAYETDSGAGSSPYMTSTSAELDPEIELNENNTVYAAVQPLADTSTMIPPVVQYIPFVPYAEQEFSLFNLPPDELPTEAAELFVRSVFN